MSVERGPRIGDVSEPGSAQSDDGSFGWRLDFSSAATAWCEGLPIGNGRLGAMVTGGPTDLALDLNLSSPSPAADFALDQARLALIVHSRAAGLVAPLDGVHPAIDDPEGLRRSIRHAYEMGFAGALCIHPRQVAVIHAALAPSAADLAWAKRVVAGGAHGAGAYQIDGQMVDAPVLLRAQRLLAARR